MTTIDLNSDMGEIPEAVRDGTQEALMESITSANVACGGHAGDEETIEATIRQALRHGVAVGAHPGYPDRANFGRVELAIAPDAIAEAVHGQLVFFAAIAERCGATITHVKAHGALYNQAVRDAKIAGAIAAGVGRWRRDVPLVGLANSPMLEVFQEAGFAVAGEAFADRRYEPDGTLRSRKFDDALIRDPEAAAAQAVQIAQDGAAQTICIHSDTPGSPGIAAAVRRRLERAGFQLASLRPEPRGGHR